jgi:prepilin-type N-terminal cleavage/methylation domain-containing protein
MKRDSGFTLIEVLIAMLVGTIGLMGTIAVQQSIISASKNANDAAVAMRLAVQKLEEFSSRTTEPPLADQKVGGAGLFPIATTNPLAWSPTDGGGNSIPEYVDAEGLVLRDGGGVPLVPPATQLGRYRWQRRWKVANSGPVNPYVISVIVTYNNDVGTPKTTRLDLERRRSW